MSFSAHSAYSFYLRSFVVRAARSLVIVRCRRGSVSSSVVVARCRLVLLAIGCRRRSCSPRGVSSAVDRLVDRFAARLLVPSCLSGGGATGGAGSFSSRAARCLGCRSLTSLGFRGAARLIRRLLACLGILRERALPLAWRVVAALPPSPPVARAVCLCG